MKIIFLVVFAIVLAGCSRGGKINLNNKKGPELVGENTEARKGVAGDQIVGNYRVYDKSLYEKAKFDGKIILLYFYANWCPTCKEQEPAVEKVFRGLAGNNGRVAFRVNYNDSEVTPDGKALADEFKVNYQHTFVVIGSDGMIKKQSVGLWGAGEMATYLRENL